MYIETQRLIMRNFKKEDISEAYEYLSDSEVMKYVEKPFDYKTTEKFILNYGTNANPLVYALMEKASSKVIGHTIFHSFENDKIYEIGFIIGRNYWGKAYALEIGMELIKYAFVMMNIDEIVAETVNENLGSKALIKKLGMKQVESNGDLLLYKIQNSR